ncbi:hypothetical protein [Sphingobacterium faecium]|uniref:hypothetical protein n=1 Tax=Sphingobacterium faecium TaxID=34087 RepID=UPI000D371A25|nr:hypothetical protein [Sphingobacterium faecium]
MEIYFNTASLVTEVFNISIESKTDVLLDTTLNQTTVVTYRKIADSEMKNNENYNIVVNGIDSLININKKYTKLFIGYQEECLFPERTDRARHPDEFFLTFDKKYHKLTLELKE